MAESKMRSVVAMANQKLSVQWAAILLSGATLVSSLLGIYRDRLLNGLYLDSYPVGIDAYTVAFTIPDFMFFILVSGALSVTFVPVFNQRLASGNRKSAWELSSSLVNFMAVITLVASVLIMIFADPLVRYIVGPGLDESGRGLAVSMMRIIAVNPFLFAVATVIASMQQAIGRFTFLALAPTIYNIGIIIGAQFFTSGINIFGWQVFDGGIMGVALGVVLGSIMQLVVSSIGLMGIGFDYQAKISWKNKGFRQVLRLLPARSLDQGIDYVNGLVETNIASRMADGTIRAYQQASALSLMPVNLVGVAISNAAFPRMTERLAEGRVDLFRDELRSVLRWIIWIALPVAVITFFGRGYVVNFIKNGGNALISGLLGALVVAILFRTIYHIAARSFYAQQDTKTPLYVSIFAIILNIILAVSFTSVFGMGVYGLAWAQSIVAVVEVVILCGILAVRIPNLFNQQFTNAIMRMVAASACTGLIAYFLVQVFQLQSNDQSFFATFPKFAIIASLSMLSYILISQRLSISEATPVINRISAMLFGKRSR
ncbi:MAG: murein biosynthesis integral membrane protein MurJ [Candidatus Saccharimonas sp.]|nr:murein biosynthesis integral membrane protein MurJ [Candidatus Saccharimonas sp.]